MAHDPQRLSQTVRQLAVRVDHRHGDGVQQVYPPFLAQTLQVRRTAVDAVEKRFAAVRCLDFAIHGVGINGLGGARFHSPMEERLFVRSHVAWGVCECVIYDYFRRRLLSDRRCAAMDQLSAQPPKRSGVDAR